MEKMTKKEIIEAVGNVKVTTEKNSMGCFENWYNPFYAIGATFKMSELTDMSEDELNNLIKLAETIADGLY